MRQALSATDLQTALHDLPGWHLESGVLVKTMTCKDFPSVIRLVNQIADLAEAANHHPDLDIRYDKLRISLVTHDLGGISARDIEMAKKITKLC